MRLLEVDPAKRYKVEDLCQVGVELHRIMWHHCLPDFTCLMIACLLVVPLMDTTTGPVVWNRPASQSAADPAGPPVDPPGGGAPPRVSV